MNLGEQLSELRENILRDRSDIIAGDTDCLWSDETLLRYVKDAEWRFARQSLIIRDGTTPQLTQVKLKAGVKDYPLHHAVLAVISGRYEMDIFDLQRSGHSLVMQANPPEFLSWNEPVDAAIPPGKPLAYYTDETLVYASQSKVTLSIYPVPSDAEDGKLVNLRIIRLPTTCYTRDNLDTESQIPESYQLDVLEWAAYRAQRTFDADAGAPTSADAHKAAFEASIAAATKEAKRAMFANMTFRYGTNGWNYTR